MSESNSTTESSGKAAYKAFMGLRIVLRQIYKEEQGFSMQDIYSILLGVEAAKLQFFENAKSSTEDEDSILFVYEKAMESAPLFLKDLREGIKNED